MADYIAIPLFSIPIAASAVEHLLNSAYKATEDCRARLSGDRARMITYCRFNSKQLLKAKERGMERARLASLPTTS